MVDTFLHVNVIIDKSYLDKNIDMYAVVNGTTDAF